MKSEEVKKEWEYHKNIEKGMNVGIKKCIEVAERYSGCSADDVIKALKKLQKGV